MTLPVGCGASSVADERVLQAEALAVIKRALSEFEDEEHACGGFELNSEVLYVYWRDPETQETHSAEVGLWDMHVTR